MKVKIGGYPDTWLRCRIHDRYMNKKYGYDWTKNNTKFEDFLERVEDTVQVIYNATINPLIKSRQRKIIVRIDLYDTWNMDNTLAHIILPMLKQIKKNKQGTPMTDDKDVPAHLRSTAAAPKENEWDTDSNLEPRWDWILDEMIYAFECEIDDDWEDQFHTGETDIQWKKLENGYSEMVHGPNHTHVFDRKSHDKAWKRRNNGLRLFGKYYHSLWE